MKGFVDPADAIVPCKRCGAVEGEPCRTLATAKKVEKLKKGFVHISRRIARLLLTARRPDLREGFERDAVKLLKEHLKEKRA